MVRGRRVVASAAVALVAATLVAGASAARGGASPDADAVAAYWTDERRESATPRDLVFDHRGLAYLRTAGGVLRPYGHSTEAVVRRVGPPPAPAAGKPGGGSDTTPPTISGMDPAAGQTIGAAYTFEATVTDASGIKSVSFVLTYPDGRTQSYAAARGSGDVWSVSFSGFWDGGWAWRVVAKDAAGRGGNTAQSALVPFTVATGGGGGGGGGNAITNAEWTGGGAVQTAVGRIYFEMPANSKQTRWNGYVCSGTAVTDTSSGRSIVLTAAHCVYDDAYKAFARNVLFIPDQAGTSGAGTDLDCSNDPLGCWAPSFGVVDSDWSSRSWPDNIPWDYAYYVVPASGAHTGAGSDTSLEAAAGTLAQSFSAPSTGSGAYTHAFGYSYSDDPNLMYCAQDMTTEGASNWWLSQCGLSGGASGGSWIQPLSGGAGPVISVNSWGYSNSPGMAGPKLSGTSASCLFDAAQTAAAPSSGRGIIPSGC